MLSVCESNKEMTLWSLTVARHTLTETQIYNKHFKNTFSSFEQLLQKQFSPSTVITYNSFGVSDWFSSSVVFREQSTKHWNTVWICSQGQEGKLLAATQNHSKCWNVLHFISYSGPGAEQRTSVKGNRQQAHHWEGNCFIIKETTNTICYKLWLMWRTLKRLMTGSNG